MHRGRQTAFPRLSWRLNFASPGGPYIIAAATAAHVAMTQQILAA